MTEEKSAVSRLEEEGDIAADYLEGLLDIADLDGDIEIGVENERASLVIEGGELSHLVGRDGEVLDDHTGLGAGVLELVLQFARGVQRVGVDHDAAGAQHAEEGDRILQNVRHHDRHAIAASQSGALLQPGTEGIGLRIEIGVGQRATHLHVGRAGRKLGERLFGHLHERSMTVDVDVGGHAGRVRLEPGAVCEQGVHGYLSITRGWTGMKIIRWPCPCLQ